jgi:hypothetical protein
VPVPLQGVPSPRAASFDSATSGSVDPNPDDPQEGGADDLEKGQRAERATTPNLARWQEAEGKPPTPRLRQIVAECASAKPNRLGWPRVHRAQSYDQECYQVHHFLREAWCILECTYCVQRGRRNV